MDDEVIRWEAPEFYYREKSTDWYWILGIVVVFGILVAIVANNVIFAILIGIGGFVFGIFASKHPDTLHCELTHRGIRVNDTAYPYTSIHSFWVSESHEERPRLLLTLKNRLAMQVIIPITIHPDIIREHLLEYVHEMEQQEPFTEKLMELIHF